MIRTTIILLLIITYAGILRVYGLDQSPPSLNWDEASFGYNAYSLMHTGRDEYGEFLPIFTRAFDEFKPTIPIFLMMPFIWLFGLNEIGVRMLSSVAGILNVLVIFFIANKLFNSKLIGYLAAFFLSSSPFAVFFSRVMFEINTGLLFFMLGYLFYLYSFKTSKFLSVLFFILSMYTYNSFKLIVPLFWLVIVLEQKDYLKNFTKNLKLISFLGVLLLPLIYLTITGEALARFQYTSIVKVWPTAIWGYFDTNNNLLVFLFTNPIILFLGEFIGRYLNYFSPADLFVNQAKDPTLHIPFHAILYPYLFIFWIIGLIAVLNNINKFKSLVILMLITPLPAAITWNWFHSIRALPLFTLFTLVIAYGVYLTLIYVPKWLISFKIPEKFSRLVIIFYVLILGLWNSGNLFDSLLVLIPMSHYGNWQPGFKQFVPEVAKIQNEYNEIIIDSPHANPYIFVLLYQSYPPAKYLSEIDVEKVSQVPRNYYDFGKYTFRKIYWPEDRYKNKTLFVGSIYSLPENDVLNQKNAKIIKDIVGKDGNVYIRIVGTD